MVTFRFSGNHLVERSQTTCGFLRRGSVAPVGIYEICSRYPGGLLPSPAGKRHRMQFALAVAATFAITATAKDEAPGAREGQRSPVLVELFTSEGCSSCPPADLLLEKLDRLQPIPGAEAIVLSEHVDYWNRIGWTDPYSSPAFSRRQEAYAHRFGLDGAYTPEMIVDGDAELLGSDEPGAKVAIVSASQKEKAPIRLSRVPAGVRIEIDAFPGRGKAEVYLAMAQDSATSDVLRGENKGRRLHHVAIVRRLDPVGTISSRARFNKQFPVKDADKSLRIIAFVQEPGNGRVWGAALLAPAK